jgi:hypothetical protein
MILPDTGRGLRGVTLLDALFYTRVFPLQYLRLRYNIPRPELTEADRYTERDGIIGTTSNCSSPLANRDPNHDHLIAYYVFPHVDHDEIRYDKIRSLLR